MAKSRSAAKPARAQSMAPTLWGDKRTKWTRNAVKRRAANSDAGFVGTDVSESDSVGFRKKSYNC